MFEIYDDIQKDNGLDPVDANNPDSLIKSLTKAGKAGGLKIKENVYDRLIRLSMMTDSFFKISYFENEVKNLQDAKEYDLQTGNSSKYSRLTDSQQNN